MCTRHSRLLVVSGIRASRLPTLIPWEDGVHDDPGPAYIFGLAFTRLTTDSYGIASRRREALGIDGLFNELRPTGHRGNGGDHPAIPDVALHDVVGVNPFTTDLHLGVGLGHAPGVPMVHTWLLSEAIHIARLVELLIHIVDYGWAINEVDVIRMLRSCPPLEEEVFHSCDALLSCDVVLNLRLVIVDLTVPLLRPKTLDSKPKVVVLYPRMVE